MSGFGAVRTASGGLRRHKVQSVVICMVLLVATASATLGLALLSASSGPFTHAFAAQRGAHLAVTADAGHVSAAQLATTGALAGVIGSSGPFPQVTVQADQGGQPFGQLVLIGRTVAAEKVDAVMITQGHWAQAAGQLVLDGQWDGVALGSQLTVSGVPLTVVGSRTRSRTPRTAG